MSQNKDIADIKATVAALSAVVMKLAEGTSGASASAATPQKEDTRDYGSPTFSIWDGGKAPMISVANVSFRPVSFGAGAVRAIDYLMANPKVWAKIRADYTKATS